MKNTVTKLLQISGALGLMLTSFESAAQTTDTSSVFKNQVK